MEITSSAIVGGVALVLSVGGSWMASQNDIGINANNIQHIDKRLERIEQKIDDLDTYIRGDSG